LRRVVRKDVVDDCDRTRCRAALEIHEVAQSTLEKVHPVDKAQTGCDSAGQIGEELVARQRLDTGRSRQVPVERRRQFDTGRRPTGEGEASPVPNSDLEIVRRLELVVQASENLEIGNGIGDDFFLRSAWRTAPMRRYRCPALGHCCESRCISPAEDAGQIEPQPPLVEPDLDAGAADILGMSVINVQQEVIAAVDRAGRWKDPEK
jgi:hypothetical protein